MLAPQPGESGNAAAELIERFARLLRKTPAQAYKAYGFAQCTPQAWTCAGVELQAGDRATALALPAFANSGRASLRVSMRVGARGIPIQGRGCTHSIVASRSGSLEVSIDHAMAVADAQATKVVVVAIVWRESALRGLRFLANAGDVDGLVRTEINRLCNPAAVSERAPGCCPA